MKAGHLPGLSFAAFAGLSLDPLELVKKS